MKKIGLIISFLFASFNMWSETEEILIKENTIVVEKEIVETNTTNYRPNVHGVITPQWEGEYGADGSSFEQRFRVRNARLTLDGYILPALTYFIQVDAFDLGSFKVLDVYGRWQFHRQWNVQAGRFRVPYGIDCFRGPGTYFFSNRSFLAKYVLNMRNLGVQVGYNFEKLPLQLEAGVFNASAISDYKGGKNSVSAAAKANYKAGPVTLSASYATTEPDSVRINLWAAGATFEYGRWFVEAEYQNKHYTNKAHRPTQGWNVFGMYAIPLVNKGVFNQLDFLFRYDGMTANSSGVRNDNGLLVTDDSQRQRITAGTQLEYKRGAFRAVVRLNYEHYFYPSGVSVMRGESNKIVTELVLKF